MRSALEWAQVRALAADGVSQREIARRLGMNRRTVARLARSEEPPRYRRASAGSQLDPFEPVLRRLLEEWPQIKAPRLTEILRDEYGYDGLGAIWCKRGCSELRPRTVRPAQRTGYRPGQVLQLDWAEMPTRPTLAGRERRVYALVASLPYSGAQTAFFSLDMTIESFLEGHVRAFEWLGGVPRECVYDNLRSVVARREGDEVVWNRALPAPARPLRLPRHRVHAGDAAREGLGRGGGALPQERLLAGAPLHAIWASSTRSTRDWRDRVCNARTARERPLPGRRAARRGAARAAAAAAGALRLVGAADDAGADRRLPAPRPLLLPGAGAARARAGRAALRPRPGLDHAPRRTRSPATSAATSRASGCRRRSCAPSRRARRRRSCCRSSRWRRPSSPTTRSCAHEPGEGESRASGSRTCSRS